MAEKDPIHTVDPNAKPGEPGNAQAGKRLKDHEADSSYGHLTDQAPVRRRDGKPGEDEIGPTDSPTTGNDERSA